MSGRNLRLGEAINKALLGATRTALRRMLARHDAPAATVTAPATAAADEIVVTLPRGREVRSREDLAALIAETERRVRAPLERGAKKIRVE